MKVPTTLVCDERGRAVDRAIDMAFRRQVHHRVGLVGGEHLAHRRGVGDVGADQHVAVVVARLLQRLLRGGVGHLVDVDHHVVGVAHQVAHHGGTDEAATAGQQHLHRFARSYRCPAAGKSPCRATPSHPIGRRPMPYAALHPADGSVR